MGFDEQYVRLSDGTRIEGFKKVKPGDGPYIHIIWDDGVEYIPWRRVKNIRKKHNG